ncbi:hypothetical protein H0H81_005977 [Sphagnurus paluster]|uniref:Uncharacterized protein n=1 Tax=Sphagnurus paluster TaxID=117069 RepID=A0A9P7GLB9_9AGAR|nr:hypothetical protein H0H81_005977 [Sphagnurus paluster]
MHTISAIALAVVALNTASTLAIPMVPAGEGLEALSIHRRAVLPAANQKDATLSPVTDAAVTKDTTTPDKVAAPALKKGQSVTDPTVPSSQQKTPTQKKGSGPTKTITVLSMAKCPGRRGKKGKKQTPSDHLAGADKKAQDSTSNTPAVKGGAEAAAKPIVARAEGTSSSPTATATPTSTTTSKGSPGASAPTPPPAAQHKKDSHRHRSAYSSTTNVGKDGATTVRRFVHATGTECHAPTGSPKAKVKGAKQDITETTPKGNAGAEGAPSKVTGKSTSPDSAKVKADTKLVARAIDILERYFGELDQLD